MEAPAKRNMNIDLLKLVFSLCIIGVHLDLFKEINLLAYRTLTQSLFRIGVPFYYIGKKTPSIVLKLGRG